MIEQGYVDLPFTPVELASIGGLALLGMDTIVDAPAHWEQLVIRYNRYIVQTWPNVVDEMDKYMLSR